VAFGDRSDVVRRLLVAAGVELQVLRLTKGRAPGHPLYLPEDAGPVAWK